MAGRRSALAQAMALTSTTPGRLRPPHLWDQPSWGGAGFVASITHPSLDPLPAVAAAGYGHDSLK